MPLKKIKDKKWEEKICQHPEYNPPMHIVLEPGTYEHTCPACGNKIVFEVPFISC